jgi:nitroreductase
MEAIELLTNRASNGKLTEPAPDAESLRIAFDAAARAPDHATLRPWRMHIIRGAARERFGALLADVVKRSKPGASEDELEKAAGKALRAPMIIAVSAVVKPSPKVPPIEQLLAAGTAAHSVLMALQARGFAGIWRTGGAAYDDVVKNAFGLSHDDAIVGFLYVGTAKQAAPEMARPKPADFVSEWSGSS